MPTPDEDTPDNGPTLMEMVAEESNAAHISTNWKSALEHVLNAIGLLAEAVEKLSNERNTPQ
jgi:hypothetical protein